MLNLHHLELFYYVAKHEGIVPACRQMPYGVQQPAVSAQLIRLEENLETPLFRRRPFQLTAAGETLFEAIAPFFNNLPDLEARLRGESRSTLRLAGLSEVMRDHAPTLLALLKTKHPDLKLTVLEADQKSAEKLILRGEADLAITVLDEAVTRGLTCRRLLRLPLALLVTIDSPWRTAEAAISAGIAGNLDLISLKPEELLPRLFKKGLQRKTRKGDATEWPTSIAVSSADLVAPYVLRGLGAGLTVSSPLRPAPAGLRELPLRGFPALSVGAFWTGRLTPLASELLKELVSVATAR